MTDNNLLVGTVGDGRYHIEALLGEGSVGAVYRAVDILTGRTVALKQWHSMTLNEEVRGRFMREATALATLDHPNIVSVAGHGFMEGVPYVALEYLEGKTVEAMIAGGTPLEPALAFELARQALTAIAYAHEHEVVHRDLKPENIFVARDAEGRPHVKILDYGLAKFMSHESGAASATTPLTATGMMIGTPLYMPPEQAAGSSVDHAVDVYAMGCVLFEMLTGRPPYLATTNVELITMHLRAPIPKLAEAMPGMEVAPELQALIDAALAKKQTERIPNAGAMLKVLNALPAEPIKRKPGTKPPPAQEPVPREAPRTPEAQASFTRSWFVIAFVLAGVGLVALRMCS
jgi:serine/threonine-protein kinase